MEVKLSLYKIKYKFLLQAGIRTLHEVGPEIKRAISGDIIPVTGGDGADGQIYEEEACYEDEEPVHRRRHSLFGNWGKDRASKILNPVAPVWPNIDDQH